MSARSIYFLLAPTLLLLLAGFFVYFSVFCLACSVIAKWIFHLSACVCWNFYSRCMFFFSYSFIFVAWVYVVFWLVVLLCVRCLPWVFGLFYLSIRSIRNIWLFAVNDFGCKPLTWVIAQCFWADFLPIQFFVQYSNLKIFFVFINWCTTCGNNKNCVFFS